MIPIFSNWCFLSAAYSLLILCNFSGVRSSATDDMQDVLPDPLSPTKAMILLGDSSCDTLLPDCLLLSDWAVTRLLSASSACTYCSVKIDASKSFSVLICSTTGIFTTPDLILIVLPFFIISLQCFSSFYDVV